MMRPAVSIVIPAYKENTYLKGCIESLLDHLPQELYEIIIVDNASNEDSQLYLRELESEQEHISVIHNGENLGYAKASNIGAKAAQGEYVLMLNNDTEAVDDFLTPMLEILKEDEHVAAVGAKLLFADNTLQHAGVAVQENRHMQHPLGGRHIYYELDANFPEANRLMEYKALTAACLLFRRDVFINEGMFDEDFWNGYEDVDLCFRLHKKDYRLVYQPEACLYHYESQSGEERFKREDQNVKLLNEKWYGIIEPDVTIDSFAKKTMVTKGGIRPYYRKITSIVVPLYNGLVYTKAMYASLCEYTESPYELILVDDCSSDGTREWVEEIAATDKRVKYIIKNENKGFPHSVNLGLKAAQGLYLVIANNDILFTRGWLAKLRETLPPGSPAALAGPVSNAVMGRQLDTEADYQSPEEMFGYAARQADARAGQTESFPRLVFFCVMLKRELVEQIGALDERFSPGNLEDDDYCLRAQLAGYEAVIRKDVFVHHFANKSFTREGEEKYKRLLETNRQKFVKKWGADPEEIWLHGKKAKEHSLHIPLEMSEAKEQIYRALTAVEDEEYTIASGWLALALQDLDALEDIYPKEKLSELLQLAASLAKETGDTGAAVAYLDRALPLTYNNAGIKAMLSELRKEL